MPLDLKIRGLPDLSGMDDNRKVKYQTYDKQILPSVEFHCIASGPTGSGKTSTVIEFLTKPELFGPNFFKRVVVFSPLNISQEGYSAYQHLKAAIAKTPNELVFEEFSKENVANQMLIQQQLKEEYGHKVPCLFIIDDASSCDHFLKTVENVVKRGRHLAISTFILFQSWMATQPTLRLNATAVMLFKPDASERAKAAELLTNTYVNSDRLRLIIDDATKERYSFFFYLKTAKPEYQYRKCLDRYYIVAK